MNKNSCFLSILEITRLNVSVCFFAILLLLSCNKEGSSNNAIRDCNNQSPSILIQGQWEWVSSQNFAWSPHFYTPATVGYTMQLNFTADSAYFYKNDSLESLSFYSLQFRNNDLTNPQSDSTLRLILGNQSNENGGTQIKVSCDTLILDYTFFDGDLVKYIRKVKK